MEMIMLKITESAATLPAQDIARARKFYEQKLGLTPGDVGPDGGVYYKTGNTGFLVFPSMGKPSGDHTQLGLDVEDVPATVNELKKSGVKFEDYDFPGLKTQDGIADMGPDGGKGAWFKDSEGNLIAIGEQMRVRRSASAKAAATNGR
jgi:predicted enzyme related to lactoylglutathione lyase